mgnify:CR=1 FL=1
MNIKQASEQSGVSAPNIRFYEKEGLLPPVKRTAGGIRDYGESDCGWVEFIKCMRSAGLPVEVLAEYVTLFMQGDHTAERRKGILIEQRGKIREKIEELKTVEKRLDYKISNYDKIISRCEAALRESVEQVEVK